MGREGGLVRVVKGRRKEEDARSEEEGGSKDRECHK